YVMLGGRIFIADLCGMNVLIFILASSLFFFQAEDGIRDRNVTGVQTCALPISTQRCSAISSLKNYRSGRRTTVSACVAIRSESRSEERRVGKEWRSRRSAYQ